MATEIVTEYSSRRIDNPDAMAWTAAITAAAVTPNEAATHQAPAMAQLESVVPQTPLISEAGQQPATEIDIKHTEDAFAIPGVYSIGTRIESHDVFINQTAPAHAA